MRLLYLMILKIPSFVAYNPLYESGMLSSVKAGLSAAKYTASAVVLALMDQPAVERRTVEQLVAQWNRTQAKVVIPSYQGKRGHPVIIARACIDEILAL